MILRVMLLWILSVFSSWPTARERRPCRHRRVRVRVIINGQFFSHRVSAGLFWRGVKFTQPYRQTRIFISRQAALATTALTELLMERA